MYEIEQGVPMPAATTDRFYAQYPFAKMKVGDSFLYTVSEKEAEQLQARKRTVTRAAFAAHQHGKRHNKKFVTRKQNATQYRIWRVL